MKTPKSKTQKPRDASLLKTLLLEGVPVVAIIATFVFFVIFWNTIIDWVGEDVEYLF